MDISLVRGSTTIVLNGTGIAAPVRGCKMDGRTGESPLRLEIALEGTVDQITDWIETVDRVFSMAAFFYGLPGEDWGWVYVTLNGETWRTPIQRGVLSFPGSPAVRGAGSQGVILSVDRPDWWEDPALTSIALSNRYGTNVTTGLTGDNHGDSGNENMWKVGAGGVGGSVPAPVWLLYSSSQNGSEVFMGEAITSDTDAGYMLEAESGSLGAGVTGAGTADVTCSNGNYRPLSWSGTSPVTLLYWDLGATETKKYRGRTFRPILRLRDLVTGGEKFWLWWRVAYNMGGTLETIQEFEGILCSTSRKLIPCPPVPVPPWPKPLDSSWAWESATVALMCQAEAAGSHAMNLDFVHMMPTEGWVRYVPVIGTITNTQIMHDSGMGIVNRTTTGGATHQPEGSGLWVYPGLAQTFYALSQEGGTMTIGNQCTVTIKYRKRRRTL
jgi:hypothetical protein